MNLLLRSGGDPQGISRVNELCSSVANREIILLDSDLLESRESVGVFMSLGLSVVYGVNLTRSELGDDPPVIVYHASNRRSKVVRKRLEAARRVLPHAPICVVIGFRPWQEDFLSDGALVYDDARSVFSLAGIGFMSIGMTADVDQNAFSMEDEISEVGAWEFFFM